jgi:uncharacterized protein YlxW (UPF0749 family)
MSEIDAREFGQLEAEVRQLQRDVSELRDDVKKLLALANKSKGGLWMGMAIASFMGGVVTFVTGKMLK